MPWGIPALFSASSSAASIACSLLVVLADAPVTIGLILSGVNAAAAVGATVVAYKVMRRDDQERDTGQAARDHETL